MATPLSKDSVRLLIRARQLLDKGLQALDNQTSGRLGGQYVPNDRLTEYRSSLLSFVCRVFGPEHPFAKELQRPTYGTDDVVTTGQGVIRAIIEEIEGGWLESTRSLISGEIFGDMLAMADELAEKNYPAAAAVLAGGVLEEHLRQLCHAHEVEIATEKNGDLVRKPASRLNADLKKAGVYESFDHSLIEAWQKLRNHAAHGEHDKYTAGQVRDMLSGVREFIGRLRP